MCQLMPVEQESTRLSGNQSGSKVVFDENSLVRSIDYRRHVGVGLVGSPFQGRPRSLRCRIRSGFFRPDVYRDVRGFPAFYLDGATGYKPKELGGPDGDW